MASHLARLDIATRLVDEGTDPAALSAAVTAARLALVAPEESIHGLLPALRDARLPVWVDLAGWDGEPSRVHDPFVEAASCLFLSDVELDEPLRTAERLLP